MKKLFQKERKKKEWNEALSVHNGYKVGLNNAMTHSEYPTLDALYLKNVLV